MIEQIISIIAPHTCAHCAAEGSLLCKSCMQALPSVKDACYRCQRLSIDAFTCISCLDGVALSRVFAATNYCATAKELVHALKFERGRAAAAIIAQILHEIVLPLSSDTIVSHVPTANSRVRIRGYDQAALIARYFAARRGLTSMTLLARVSQARQVGASATDRARQMEDAFRLLPVALPRSSGVLLIDDVITTGSTLRAATIALQATNVQTIQAAVFARA